MSHNIHPAMVLFLSLMIGTDLPCRQLAYSADSSIEFSLLERLRSLREHPDGPQVREDLFALGEYYYKQKSFSASAEYFNRFDPSDLNSSKDLIAAAYLILSYSKEKDFIRSSFWRRKIEEAAFSGPYFSLKTRSRLWFWQSPLKNQFEFREGVDRMEILMNGKAFYAVDIS